MAAQQDERAHALGKLLDSFRQAGLRFREALGLADERFEARLKKRFEQAIAGAYRGRVEGKLDQVGADPFQVSDRLQKDRALRWRWSTGRVARGWDTLLVAVAVFDIDLDGLFPRGRDAVAHGVLQTVTWVRRDELNETCPDLTRAELECLYHGCTSPAWHTAQEARSEEGLALAARRVLREVRRHDLAPGLRTYEDVQRVMQEWSIPWLVFHTTVPFDWVF